MNSFVGTVVEESLVDKQFLNELEVLTVRVLEAERAEDRWHLYRVRMSEKQIQQLAGQLKPEKWYAHFWDEQTIYVVFPGKTFEITRENKTTWQPAIDYGLSLNIPQNELNFVIDE